MADPVIKQGPDMEQSNLNVGDEPTSFSPDVTTNIKNYRRWDPLNLIKDWIVVGLFVTVLVIDQVSKLVVKSNLTLYESWPEQGFLRITHGTNRDCIWIVTKSDHFSYCCFNRSNRIHYLLLQ